MHSKRRIFSVAAAAGALTLLSGHSPYRRFQMYRKTRLIVTHVRTDARAGLISEALANLFVSHWPDSMAESASAVDGPTLVNLITSRQLEVALLPRLDAIAACGRAGAYSKLSEPAPLVSLAEVDGYVLVGHREILEPVARKVATALAAGWGSLPVDISRGRPTPSVRTDGLLTGSSVAQEVYQRPKQEPSKLRSQ